MKRTIGFVLDSDRIIAACTVGLMFSLATACSSPGEEVGADGARTTETPAPSSSPTPEVGSTPPGTPGPDSTPTSAPSSSPTPEVGSTLSPTPGPGSTPDVTFTPPVDLDGDGAPAADDCDDDDSTAHPGGDEVCDGKDNDCDGQVDKGLTSTYYPDTDEDGYGDPASSVAACTAPDGYVANGDDCDDDDPSVNPDTVWYQDLDMDAYGDDAELITQCLEPAGYALADGDCDDSNGGIYPGAPETCNLKDDDCDELVDEGVTTTWYPDADGDGYGTDAAEQACSQPPQTAPVPGDCDDGKADVHPGAIESSCDEIDQNCDGKDDCPHLWGTLSTADADVTFQSITLSEGVGRVVAAAGDTDGDACPDLLFGAPTADSYVGAVYLVPGCSNIASGGTIPLDPGAGSPKVIRYDHGDYPTYVGGDLAGGIDIDGDHLSDFLVGTDLSGGGGAYFVHGVKSVPPPWDLYLDFDDSTESWLIDGYTPGSGNGVALGGDFIGPDDDEPAPDIVLGGVNASYCGDGNSGAEIYPGPFGSENDLDTSAIGMKLCGTASHHYLGASISFVGDINGDDCDDLTISDPYNSDSKSSLGSVFLVYGPCKESAPSDLTLNDYDPDPGYVAFAPASVSTSNRLGWSLGGTCHIGAGQNPVDPERPDLLFGDHLESSNGYDAGAVFLVYGESISAEVSRVTVPPSGSNVPVIALRGESDNDEAGYSVACAGDVDGNGYDDILIGAPYWDAQGATSYQGSAYLLYAASDGSGIGNVDNNGRNLNTADLIIRGSSSDIKVGYSVAGVGDVNGDGYADILIGATDIQGSGFGGAYLFYGGPQ